MASLLNQLKNILTLVNQHPKKVALAGLLLIALQRRMLAQRKKREREAKKSDGPKKQRIGADFYQKLKRLLRVVIPGVGSKEFFILALHTTFLVARTVASIVVARIDGLIVKTIVDRDASMFTYRLLTWILLAIPATYINSMIKFLETKLSLAFRTRLTDTLRDLYMNNEVFYRVENLDSRLQNADQLITEDVKQFCDKLARVHSQLSKPLLDCLLMTGQLALLSRSGALSAQEKGQNTSTVNATVKWVAAGAIFVVYMSGQILQAVAPPFGSLVAQQAQLEGELRYAHSRLITNSEEIAFYGGEAPERAFLSESYTRLVKHINRITSIKVPYNMLEGFLMKYVWSATGFAVIAVPTFVAPDKVLAAGATQEQKTAHAVDQASARTQDFVTARGLLVNLADAIQRIFETYQELRELAGFTHRVDTMLTVLEECSEAKYEKALASGADQALMNSRGKVTDGHYISFNDVSIITPNGDVLVEHLSFEMQPGCHTFITGPNGCGKSSLFRILAGLWPVYKGEVVKPFRRNLFYIPQRPYLVVGSLRAQIIYPHTEEDMRAAGIKDSDLDDLMQSVFLSHVVEREADGWDAVENWSDALSGGEKQRLAMARLFYHKPAFAVLDECTSACSIDSEDHMYQHAKDIGITLLTVSHRHTLLKHHDYLLQLGQADGGYTFSKMDANAMMTLKEEKNHLEQALVSVPKKTARLEELCAILGENSVVLDQVEKRAAMAAIEDIDE